jgi:hypothetical protein
LAQEHRDRWFVARALRRIFGFRAQAMRFRFGIGPRP